jgi:hypothetical protein
MSLLNLIHINSKLTLMLCYLTDTHNLVTCTRIKNTSLYNKTVMMLDEIMSATHLGAGSTNSTNNILCQQL